MVTHEPATLRRFLGTDDVRLVFARTSDGDVVRMPNGEAEGFRADARAGLLTCVVNDCPDKRLIVHSRAARQDGFSHHGNAGGHSGMGYHHLQSQLLVADWLRQRYPATRVELEETTEDGRRRADVMLTAPNGVQWAFEVQYAGLSVRDWRERHNDYRKRGIVDVWLWGHVPPHLRREPGTEDTVLLGEVQRAVAEEGMPVLWINPELAEIGAASDTHSHARTGRHFRVSVAASHAQFTGAAITEYSLDLTYGLASPLLQHLRDQAAELADLEAEDERLAQVQRDKAAQLVLNRQQHRKRVTAKRDISAAQWSNNPHRERVTAEFGGRWPNWLNITVEGYGEHRGQPIYLPWTSQHWQALLYLRFMHEQPDRTLLSIKEMSVYLRTLDADTRLEYDAVSFWVHTLADRGIIEKTSERRRDGTAGTRYVTRDRDARRSERQVQQRAAASAKDAAAQAAAVAEAEAEAEQATRAAIVRRGEPTPTVPQHSNPPTVEGLRADGYEIPDLPPPLQGQDRCYECYGRLEPDAGNRGYHTSCMGKLFAQIGASLPTVH